MNIFSILRLLQSAGRIFILDMFWKVSCRSISSVVLDGVQPGLLHTEGHD